jgi:phosphate transport system substrate-binding protein
MEEAVKALGIKKASDSSPVLPSLQTALDDTYPVSRGLFYYTDGEPEGLIKAFIDFALSDEGQALVESAGFVPVVK